MYRLWVNIKILVASHTNESYLMGIVDGNCTWSGNLYTFIRVFAVCIISHLDTKPSDANVQSFNFCLCILGI